MDFASAMKCLQEGKKVRCIDWDEIVPSEESPEVPGVCTVSIDWMKIIKTQWELYEEEEKLLSFAEMVKGLREGKKYRRKNWENEHFWIRLGHDVCDNIEDTYVFLREDFEYQDWVEVSDA